MKKISSKQIFMYVVLIGILIVVAVYMLVYKKYSDLAEATRQSNEALQVRVDSLKVYYDNEQQYIDDKAAMEVKINEILEKYPSDNREEDVIMQAVYTQMATPITYSGVNIGEPEVIQSVGADVVAAADLEGYENEIAFVEQTGTYVNDITYDSLKYAIQTLYDSDYVIGIKSITYSKGDEDMLNGNLDLVFYSVKGNNKEYTLPNILPYVSGTNNIFGSTVVTNN